jgi:hypothetical protein
MRFLKTLPLLALTALPLAAQQRPEPIDALLKRPVDAARRIAAGESKSGALTDASLMLDDSSRVELWYFEGKEGQRVTVRQRSSEFDSFLHVGRLGAAEPDVQNDDAEDDGLNSAAELTLPADGMYVIVANTFEKNGRGPYTLTLEVREPAPGMSGPQTPATATLREPEPDQRLGLNQRFGSQLDAKDGTMDDGTHFEVWYVQATAGDTLHVEVQSAEFPPAVHVGRQGSGSVLVEATDASKAMLRFNVMESGTLAVIVRSTRPAAVGSYTLHVVRASTSR